MAATTLNPARLKPSGTQAAASRKQFEFQRNACRFEPGRRRSWDDQKNGVLWGITMKHSGTRALFSYWNGLRGERAAPERSEIDPTAIRHVLADTFMLEVDMAQRFPLRLAGTRVNALFGTEQKGKSFLDLWRNEERRNIAAILLTVADSTSPVVAGGAACRDGKEECALEFLFLPLRHHGKTHSRILGLVKPSSKPSWLGLVPLGPVSLRSLRIIDSEEIITHQAARRAVGRAPLYAVSPPAYTPPPPRKPYLRLIQGGR